MPADVVLRPAVSADETMIFAWRNHPAIIAAGIGSRPVTWEEHREWFARVTRGDRHLLFVIQHESTPIGQVRFDRIADDECEASIYLLPEYTGRGLGTYALKQGTWEAFGRLGAKRIAARIHRDNRQSRAAFARAGFREEPGRGSDGHVLAVLERPAPVPHNRLTFGSEEVEALRRAVASGQWAAGPGVRALERELAERTGVRYAVAVASGLSALRLALGGLGVRRGEAVLVPAYSCVALANAVLAHQAVPVPVDVRPGDWNMDPAGCAAAAKASGARLAIVVHTFGAPASVREIAALGLTVIEDCAHAFGMNVSGKPLGRHGHAAVLSFHATKLIGAGEGGAVLTDADEVARFTAQWRDYADQPAEGTRLNDKMSELTAAVAACQLARLDTMLADRRRLAERYTALLTPAAQRAGWFQLPVMDAERVWYRYAPEIRGVAAAAIAARMGTYDVSADAPVWDWREAACGSHPVADRAYRSVLSLPLYPTLSEEEQDRVVHAFLSACREYDGTADGAV